MHTHRRTEWATLAREMTRGGREAATADRLRQFGYGSYRVATRTTIELSYGGLLSSRGILPVKSELRAVTAKGNSRREP